ncbi:molybdopterin converting factor subunit 1 [Paenibacillus crassostreae]|uniref:Molybdopterin synthase sulfur carrier subunit n=1 Tax=Paenibacillus crassostreae TaxID=1763538 RepID=A0A167DKM4_9BACL|nr:molybdopterin converting factor subunit 1 [Paenibacillus crassostreae]AOZ91342.1 molybdopterin converting factor subunit 1 [Paenibacillus crassostreae]OAB74499.1 molybdopterin synthase sulfur carrier subunit [Paenibacillus crassostreae]
MKILLFAHLREEFGASSLSLDLGEITVTDLFEELEKRYANSSLHQVMVAVNEQFVNRDYLIQADDTVALLPPVSGG